MKTYLNIIKNTQTILLAISIAILIILPSLLVFYPESLNLTLIYFWAHISLFAVMIIRPLADLLPQFKFIRPLVILRKGTGVFSAAIIVSFILSKIIINPADYFYNFITSDYWSLTNLALFAHLADISAILLLITSNNLSKRLLGNWWKRIQRLSYVYFYGSSFYLLFILGDNTMIFYIIIVTFLTVLAFWKNRQPRLAAN